MYTKAEECPNMVEINFTSEFLSYYKPLGDHTVSHASVWITPRQLTDLSSNDAKTLRQKTDVSFAGFRKGKFVLMLLEEESNLNRKQIPCGGIWMNEFTKLVFLIGIQGVFAVNSFLYYSSHILLICLFLPAPTSPWFSDHSINNHFMGISLITNPT